MQQEMTSNDCRILRFPNVSPGLYTVNVEASGFKKFDSVHNKLDANSTLELDAALTVGAATETVEVVASAQVLQTESGAVGKDVTRSQIDGLELNGRDPSIHGFAIPGMRSGSTLGDFSFSLTNGGYSVNGARSQETTITIDGAPAVRTRANGTGIAVADVDSTEEMQVLTSNYAAEYGRADGGQIRIVTKGGGSSFHGGAYEYFRNSDMNANTWSRNQSTFTNFASPFRYNQFGFNVGGPIFIPENSTVTATSGSSIFGEEWVKLPQRPDADAGSSYRADACRAISANCWVRTFSTVSRRRFTIRRPARRWARRAACPSPATSFPPAG